MCGRVACAALMARDNGEAAGRRATGARRAFPKAFAGGLRGVFAELSGRINPAAPDQLFSSELMRLSNSSNSARP